MMVQMSLHHCIVHLDFVVIDNLELGLNHIIIVYDLHHNCLRTMHKWRGPTQKFVWLGDTLAPRYVEKSEGPCKRVVI